EGLRILGCSRSDQTDDAFRAKIKEAVRIRAPKGELDETAWTRFSARLGYVPGDASAPDMYGRLKARLGASQENIFYLSTSPSLYDRTVITLAAAGLAGGRSRVVVEKPLGHDLASCREINDTLAKTFSEDKTFRIDHYLGKEAVQNLLALRFANTFFEPLWNKLSIDHVQITVAETVGVEGRWGYYDAYGAMRDMVQNHLLQLLCLVAMEPPASLDADSVRNEKVKVLRSLRRINGREVPRTTGRRQYT